MGDLVALYPISLPMNGSAVEAIEADPHFDSAVPALIVRDLSYLDDYDIGRGDFFHWFREVGDLGAKYEVPVITALSTFQGKPLDLAEHCDTLFECEHANVIDLRLHQLKPANDEQIKLSIAATPHGVILNH